MSYRACRAQSRGQPSSVVAFLSLGFLSYCGGAHVGTIDGIVNPAIAYGNPPGQDKLFAGMGMGAIMTRLIVVVSVLAYALVLGTSEGIAQRIYGAGSVSCGDWLKYRDQKMLGEQYQAQAWIDGLISGINLAKSNGPDLFASFPGKEGMYAWIDNYCRSKPLDKLVSAGMALAEELKARAK